MDRQGRKMANVEDAVKIVDGVIKVDLDKTNEYWESLSMEQQYNAMCIMFDPIIVIATKQKKALQDIAEATSEMPLLVDVHKLARDALE